jgi:hypothetical protein
LEVVHSLEQEDPADPGEEIALVHIPGHQRLAFEEVLIRKAAMAWVQSWDIHPDLMTEVVETVPTAAKNLPMSQVV